MKKQLFCLSLCLTVGLISCQKEELVTPEQPAVVDEDVSAEMWVPQSNGSRAATALNYNEDLHIVSFNVHGATKSELETFKSSYLDGTESVICLQEVTDPDVVMDVFNSGPSHRNEDAVDSYPYYQAVRNYTIHFDPILEQENYIMILSKFPIVAQQSTFLQQDPGGDKWKRHGQYVRLKVNSSTSIRVFHFHNTYNWNNNNFQWEKSGMQAFRDWASGILGGLSGSTSNVFLTGDFNLTSQSDVEAILGSGFNYAKDWRDYVVSSTTSINSSGEHNVPSNISDHDAVYAKFSMTTNRYNALNRVVRVYEHSNFNGRVASFEVGTSNYLPNTHSIPGNHHFWNDRISSIRWSSYVSLYAWQHMSKGGTKYCFPNVSGCASSGWNDKFSSLQVF